MRIQKGIDPIGIMPTKMMMKKITQHFMRDQDR